jgi:DNA-binding NtrC family response regulator
MIHWQVGMTLEEVEKQVILKAMQIFNNNKTHVAQALGVSIRTIQNKMAKYTGESAEASAEDHGGHPKK